MTYEELLGLMSEGDAVIIPGCRVEMTEDGVVVHGYDSPAGFAPDIKVRIEGDKLRAWVKEHVNVGEGDMTMWSHETVFDRYEDFQVWTYEW